jgi:hypothetical protein
MPEWRVYCHTATATPVLDMLAEHPGFGGPVRIRHSPQSPFPEH